MSARGGEEGKKEGKKRVKNKTNIGENMAIREPLQCIIDVYVQMFVIGSRVGFFS